jgi:hypothetical protein
MAQRPGGLTDAPQSLPRRNPEEEYREMKKNIALIMMAALILPALVMPGNAQRTSKVEPNRANMRSKGDDPDLPKAGFPQINKKEYLMRREAYMGLVRATKDDPTGQRRAKAVDQMEQQERQSNPQAGRVPGEPLSPTNESSRVWTPLGPDPIPNGGTQGQENPTSGRTVTIAVHPTNPDIVYFGAASGGVYRTLDGGKTFTQLMDTAATQSIGFVALAPSDPSILFVGTGEGGFCLDCFFGRGLYRISDADSDQPKMAGPFTKNSAHENVFIGRGISAIAVDPTNPSNVFVTTYSGFSGIDGDIFKQLPSRGLYRSTNALSNSPTFDKVSITGSIGTTNRPMSDVVLDPGDHNTLLLYAYGGFDPPDGGVYRSTDALAATPTFEHTLTIGENFLDVNLRGELAITRVNNATTVYLASGETPNADTCPNVGQFGTLRKSTDGGATWSGQLPAGNGFCGGQCFYDIAVGVSPTDPSKVLLGGNVRSVCSESIARSTDGGATFVNRGQGVHADQQEVVFAPSNPQIVYEGNDGGIWKSINGGNSFFPINRKGYSATQFESIALHPTDRHFMIGGTQDNGTEFLRPNRTWLNADGGDGGYARIDQSATNTSNVTMYHTYFNFPDFLIGFARLRNTVCTLDKDWVFRGCGFEDPTLFCSGEPNAAPNGIDCSDNVNFYAPLELGPVGSAANHVNSTVYFGTTKLYRSVDEGDTMTVVHPSTGESFFDIIGAIGISPQNDDVRIIGKNGGQVFVTNTGANPMIEATPPGAPFKYVSRAVIDPNNQTTAYVTYTGYGVPNGQHVWKTTNLGDSGTTWQPVGNGIPDVPVNAFVVDPSNSQHLYAGTDIGVYRSINGGASWGPFTKALPRVPVFELAIQNPHRVLRAATHGRGIWEISLKRTVAKVADFNGDGRTDLSVQRPDTGTWHILNSTLSITIPNTTSAKPFLATDGSDKLVPGDYDADGKTDVAVFRPSEGTWRIKQSSGSELTVTFGQAGDLPVPGDYDGDGKTDVAVFRPTDGNWYRIESTEGFKVTHWGQNGDKPVQGDYDGDGKTDLAVFRPAEANWYIAKSSTNYTTSNIVQWGLSTDKLVPGDYNGNGRQDVAVWRPSTGTWYVLTKIGKKDFTAVNWGQDGDIPTPGDYDGDGMTDFAVWRPSPGDWFVLKSSNQPIRGQHWGQPGDTPVPSTYIPEQ